MLESLKKQVHAKGFNISMMINRFKKEQKAMKAVHKVPDEVYIEVCKDILSRPLPTKPWPYFMKVLVLKSHEHFAASVQEEAKASRFSKTMPQHIKDIMRNS